MDETDFVDPYDAIAPLYEEYSSNRQAYLDAVDELVIRNLKPEFRLLDIGSGDGRRLAKIKNRVGLTDIVAVEPSPEMAKICQDRLAVSVHQTLGEDIDQLDIGQFDAATALWNIFGHIPNSEARLKTLKNIKQKLKKGGKLILDVNNRHNALAYGWWKVLMRVFVDRINFRESRGDAHYQWQIGDQTFNASGHLFTPFEMERLFNQAGLKMTDRFTLNYATGQISRSRYRGQLFYILEH